jgi:hypothetical protein
MQICSIISDIIQEIIRNNLPQLSDNYSTEFDGDVVENYTMKLYLERIISLSSIESSTMIYAFALFDIYCEKNDFYVTEENSFKLIFVAIAISMKFNEDVTYRNKDFAEIGGLSTEEFNFLEVKFLTSLDYKIKVSEELYMMYAQPFNSI